MDAIRTINVMLFLIFGLVLMISSWYLMIALLALIIIYHLAKTYVTVKRIVDE